MAGAVRRGAGGPGLTEATAGGMAEFDRIAPHYDRLERWFSRGLMQSARVAHLPSISRCRHALLLGEGPGRFLPLVLRQFPQARVTCVDSSAKMIMLARREVAEANDHRVAWVQADIHSWQPHGERFDLIATNFFLDCFEAEDLAQIVPRIAATAEDQADWLIADFNLPARGFARWRASLIVGGLYRAFGLATGLATRRLISCRPWLEEAGFQLHRRTDFDFGLVRSDWWTRTAGQNNAS